MAYRIFRSGNYFYIVDGNGREKDGLARDVIVTRASSASTEFRIRNVNNWNHTQYLDVTTDILDEDGNAYTVDSFIEFYENNTGVNSKSYSLISSNDLGYDAWGRAKTVKDISILHGMFTYNVPVTVWYETINGAVQTTITNSTSVDGALNFQAGATLNDLTYLRTFRNPRYEPNRGLIYSTAAVIVNPTALMNRRFGIFTAESGTFFSLESGTLYGVIRTTKNSVTTDDKYELDTTDIDLSKGNIYDIQYQWRGVGDYKFFINLKEVGHVKYLGTLTSLSMYNPANPVAFESKNLGDNDLMLFGCVDVSSEGGLGDGKQYGSVGITNESGQVSISGYNVPVIAIRSKTTVSGLINTRDTLALLLSSYSDGKAFVRVWATRDFTAITENDQAWVDFGDGHLEYMQYDNPDVTTPMTFNTAKATLIFGGRVGVDLTYETSALFEDKAGIYLTPGEMFIFTMHRETGASASVGVTFEFAEEI